MEVNAMAHNMMPIEAETNQAQIFDTTLLLIVFI
jgi:hypothetical protein